MEKINGRLLKGPCEEINLCKDDIRNEIRELVSQLYFSLDWGRIATALAEPIGIGIRTKLKKIIDDGHIELLVDEVIGYNSAKLIIEIEDIIAIQENIDISQKKKQIDRLATAIIEMGILGNIIGFRDGLKYSDLVEEFSNIIARLDESIVGIECFGKEYNPSLQLSDIFDAKVEELIKKGNIEKILEFTENKLQRMYFCKNEKIQTIAKKLMDFVTATNNPKYVYLLATSNKFGQNRTLLNALIKINIPAFIYLYAATIENISEDDMELIVAYMLTTNDTKLIGYLLWHLRDKNNVSNDLKLALQNKLNELNDKYWFISYDIKTPNKLKGALLSDDIQMLAEFGIVLNEDNLYDDKKQLVLVDIQAGL